jgi:DNA-binding transcriptional LysR family regulator
VIEVNDGRSKMMDAAWPDLQAFLAVVRTGSLAAAAKRLRTSAPTLGRRIAALEAQLGLRLFAKATAGYRLTQAGEQLLRPAEAVEQTVLAFLRRRDGLSQDVTGTVRVSAPETIVTHLLSPLLPKLHKRHPGLVLSFTTGPALVNLPRRGALAPDFVGSTDPDLLELFDRSFLVQPLWLVTSEETRGAARTEAVIAWIVDAVRGTAKRGTNAR